MAQGIIAERNAEAWLVALASRQLVESYPLQSAGWGRCTMRCPPRSAAKKPREDGHVALA
jgi:hypothetical protein